MVGDDWNCVNADWVVAVVYFAWLCLVRATDFTMDGLISAVGVGSGGGGWRLPPTLSTHPPPRSLHPEAFPPWAEALCYSHKSSSILSLHNQVKTDSQSSLNLYMFLDSFETSFFSHWCLFPTLDWHHTAIFYARLFLATLKRLVIQIVKWMTSQTF